MEKKVETLTLWNIIGFVAVVIGLMWVYSEDNEEGRRATTDAEGEGYDWSEVSSARKSAVAYAGAIRLAQAGADVGNLELVAIDTFDGSEYTIMYSNAGEKITLHAEIQCDRLDIEKLKRPTCWTWR